MSNIKPVKDNETEEKLSVENGGDYKMENLIKSEVKMEINDVEKSQFISDTTVVETNQVDSCMALKDTTTEDLSQVTSLDTITPHTATPSEKENKDDKPKQRRKKERRKKEKWLKFHEKLVKTSGLPLIRLMERKMLIGNNLASDFEQLAWVGAEFAHVGEFKGPKTLRP